MRSAWEQDMRILGLVALTSCAGLLPAAATRAVTIEGRPVVLAGDRPGLSVTGLAPRSEVTLESFRRAPVYVRSGAEWSKRPILFHAEARFWADEAGRVDVDATPPVAGSYTGVDPRGLLWSGAVVGRTPEPDQPDDVRGLDGLADGQVRLVARVDGRVVASRDLTIIRWRDGVRFTTLVSPALTGVFAAPAFGRRRPTVILLHGSEGGSLEAAREEAGRYASRGYAALALIYFSWPSEHLTTVPQSFASLPVERMEAARAWLSRRREVDAERLAVVGGSKGAEFGLLAATLYPWIGAVVACVPSSVVWGGFGSADAGRLGSFSRAGKPVPSIPYGDYGPVERREITSAQRHERDRAAADPSTVASAIIPIERSRASLLLISGGRDAVWPSDAMSAEMVARLGAVGGTGRVRWLFFPDAGHYLCGTGGSPIRYSEADEVALGGGLVSADGRDPGRAWEATLGFLRTAIGSPAGPARRPARHGRSRASTS